MDEYELGSADPTSFDTANRWRSVDGVAALFSSTSTNQFPLDSGTNLNSDFVALVSYNKEDYTIDGNRDDIATIIHDWGLPKIATKHFLCKHGPQGLYKISGIRQRCTWYHLPTVEFVARFNTSGMDICQMLDESAGRSHFLVFCPSHVRADVSSALQSWFSNMSASDAAPPIWPVVHSIFAKCAIRTWEESTWAVSSLVAISLRGIAVARKGALDSSLLEECDHALQQLHLFFSGLQATKLILQRLREEFSQVLLSHKVATTKTSDLFTNLINDSNNLILQCTFLNETLEKSRRTLTSCIEIQNASYMRQNTIALRRIGEQNQAESKQVIAQSQLSQKNSETMTKISYMTMFYLPSTFIATFFSMPFLNLDDNLKFKAINKIWVFIVVAVLATIITFLFWAIFDHSSVILGSWFKLVPKSSASTIDDDKTPAPDTSTLEPKAYVHPDPHELIQQVSAIIGGRRGGLEERGGNDALHLNLTEGNDAQQDSVVRQDEAVDD